MVTASEMGKKGGSVKSEAKTAAARKNASKPRKKPMPEFDTLHLLKLAALELQTERRRLEMLGERYESLRINGHLLVDVLMHHIKTQEA